MLIESMMMLALALGLGSYHASQDGKQPEALPDGMTRTAAGGIAVGTLPSYEPALAAAAKITQGLSVSSLEFGEDGRLSSFTARYWGEQPLPIGTSFAASSITVDANGIVRGVIFADDTGCDMIVTIEGGHVTYDCVVTTCETVGDTVLSGPSGGLYTITCECRSDDPPQ